MIKELLDVAIDHDSVLLMRLLFLSSMYDKKKKEIKYIVDTVKNSPNSSEDMKNELKTLTKSKDTKFTTGKFDASPLTTVNNTDSKLKGLKEDII